MILDGLASVLRHRRNRYVGSGTGQGTAGMGDDPMLTAITASNNVIDLQNARDMGIGDNPALKIICIVSVAGVGGTSVTVSAQASVDNSTWVTLATGPTILTANLLVGTHLCDLGLAPHCRGPDGSAGRNDGPAHATCVLGMRRRGRSLRGACLGSLHWIATIRLHTRRVS